jgi:hypothetical protein
MNYWDAFCLFCNHSLLSSAQLATTLLHKNKRKQEAAFPECKCHPVGTLPTISDVVNHCHIICHQFTVTWFTGNDFVDAQLLYKKAPNVPLSLVYCSIQVSSLLICLGLSVKTHKCWMMSRWHHWAVSLMEAFKDRTCHLLFISNFNPLETQGWEYSEIFIFDLRILFLYHWRKVIWINWTFP